MQGRHKKQTGGRGQFGDCWLEVEPLPRGAGFEFEDDDRRRRRSRASSSRRSRRACEKRLTQGVLAGFRDRRRARHLYDGSYHDVDSSEMAFKIAGHIGFKKALRGGEADAARADHGGRDRRCPTSWGDVIGDLNSRRGKVLGVEPKGETSS